MCERCKEMEHKKVDHDVMQKGVEAMKAWAAEPISYQEALAAIDPERMEQENAAMREAIGLSLEEIWGLYGRLGEGGAQHLDRFEARGLRDWLTILIRSRAEMQITRDRAMGALELATALLRVQNGGAPWEEESKEVLH